MAQHILVIEDDLDLVALVRETLENAGYSTAHAISMEECEQAIESQSPDLILLDINLNLPGTTGLDLCQHFRKTLSVPILILSGSEDDFDKVAALQVGADNYLTKPINPKVLVSFVKAALKRADTPVATEGVIHSQVTLLCFGDFVLNIESQKLTKGDKDVHLKPAEFKLLSTLAQNPNRVLSRERLLDLTSSSEIFERTIDTLVSALRKKIEENPKKPSLIKSIYGSGYMFEAEVVKKSGAV